MTGATDSPPVFVISLERASDRRATIRRHLDATGASYEIINAVDGRALDLTQLADRLNPEKYRIKYGRKFTPGEIGCYLSHYNLWQRIVEQGIDCAVILEDDTVLDEDFFEVVSSLPGLEWQWELILLSSHNRKAERVLCDLANRRRLIRHKRRAWGAVAYVIRRPAAEKLLDYCYEIRAGIDESYSEYWKNNVAVYLVDPPPARHAGTETFTPHDYASRTLTEKIKGSIQRKTDRWRQILYCWINPPQRIASKNFD